MEDRTEECLGVLLVEVWRGLVGVPDNVNVITRDQEHSWVVQPQLEELAVSLDSRHQEPLIPIVRQGNLQKMICKS